MTDALKLLTEYGEMMLFGAVFIEQLGLPIPAAPFLLAAGALTAKGEMNGAVGWVAASLGCLLADLLWFKLGGLKGAKLLSFLQTLFLGSNAHVRRAQELFSRHGMKALIAAKFIPGISGVMAPLAGIFKLSQRRFILLDGLGCLLYTGGFLAVGFGFSDALLPVLPLLVLLGYVFAAICLLPLVVWLGLKRFRNRERNPGASLQLMVRPASAPLVAPSELEFLSCHTRENAPPRFHSFFAGFHLHMPSRRLVYRCKCYENSAHHRGISRLGFRSRSPACRSRLESNFDCPQKGSG